MSDSCPKNIEEHRLISVVGCSLSWNDASFGGHCPDLINKKSIWTNRWISLFALVFKWNLDLNCLNVWFVVFVCFFRVLLEKTRRRRRIRLIIISFVTRMFSFSLLTHWLILFELKWALMKIRERARARERDERYEMICEKTKRFLIFDLCRLVLYRRYLDDW